MKTTAEFSLPENEIRTFRKMRRTIGYLGAGLPVVLFVLSFVPFFHTCFRESISHYYYSNLRELFTGSLCAVALFLMQYQGHKSHQFWRNESLLTNLAGVMLLGVALFPTDPGCFQKIYSLIYCTAPWLGGLHYFFAGVFFISLSFISLFVFVIGQKETEDLPEHPLNENNIYRICGIIMLLCLVLIAFTHFHHSTFLFEAIALFAFGTSWLIKGRGLGDRGRLGRVLYRERN